MQSLNTDKTKNELPLAITMGEPGGINSEILLKALKKIKKIKIFVICDPSWIEGSLRIFQLNFPINIISSPSGVKIGFLNILPLKNNIIFNIGNAHKANNKAIIESIDTAVSLAQAKKISGVITLPIYKKILMDDGFNFPGHTEYLSYKDNSKSLMILMNKEIKVATVTTHIPISQVPKSINKNLLIEKCSILNNSMINDFNIKQPKIVISSLNPHAGEEGQIGEEEIKIILPAIKEIKKAGINVIGPLPADTLFHKDNLKKYDVRLCMFHDQALIPVKTIDFYNGVNFSAGLSFVRTSPDHGTAFDIAGKNLANPDSLISSIKQAKMISKNRQKND